MRAVVYRGEGRVALEKRRIPRILDPRDALIRVTLTTICSSDIHIKHGAVPRAVPGVTLGHEFVGQVVETGSFGQCGDILWGMFFLPERICQ